ncbi:hypothetical protein SynMITS9220_02288 [Synechococcus sp. MIT S9220]|uniref:hypothetical protein n=1 Tax=Synechococcus sp. MIT S9220 TaxID=166309 RepID=UPI00164A86CC|nr:hypothetical protein [Synechococcus sp. MIT S9220]QNJ23575.1 hypothetical protein SynMITS9220_02288 [Synechococcus sp. MIT S9220]
MDPSCRWHAEHGFFFKLWQRSESDLNLCSTTNNDSCRQHTRGRHKKPVAAATGLSDPMKG